MSAKCTPQFNQETRDLLRQQKDLERIAKGAESGDFTKAMQAKAHDLIDEGKSAAEVLAGVHEYINQYVPHTEAEVLSAINNSKRAAPTKTEASIRRTQIAAELRDLEEISKTAPEPNPGADKNARQRNNVALRERQLEDEINALSNDITRVSSEPVTGGRIAELTAERDKLKSQIDNPAERADAAAQALIKARIAEIERQLAGGKPEGKRQGADSEAVAKLKAERDAKQAELDASRAAREPTEEDRKVAQLEKQLKDLLEGKKPNGPKQDRPDTERIAAVRAELEAARAARDAANKKPPIDPADTYNKARQTALRKQLAELDRRIRENDFAKPEPKPKPEPNAETMRLQSELNILRNKADALIARQKAKNRSLPRKIADLVTDIHLAVILTSVHVYEKLAAAVGFREASTLMQMGVMTVAKNVHGIEKWANLAPRHGTGLSLDALRARYAGVDIGDVHAGGVGGILPGMKRQMVEGSNWQEAAFGGKGGTSDEFAGYAGTLHEALKERDYWHAAKIVLSWPGRTHSVVKEVAVQLEFPMAYHLEDAHLRQTLADKGMKPAQIDEFLSRESTRAMIGAKALDFSFEAKNQEKVAAAEIANRLIADFDRHGVGGQIAAFLLRNYFPIRKIGISIAKEGTSLTIGGIKAFVRAHGSDINDTDAARLQANAEYISKNIAKQGVGLVALAVAAMVQAYFPNAIGGVPGAGKKDKDAKTKEGTAKVGDTDISAAMFHSPLAAQLQLGASVYKLYEKDYGKEAAPQAFLDAAADAYGAQLAHTITYIDQPLRTAATIQYGRGQGRVGPGLNQVAGDMIRNSTVPLMLQQYAAWRDPYKKFRKPQNIAQDIAVGIPGLRERVPKKKPRR
jgi:hypothetical protein